MYNGFAPIGNEHAVIHVHPKGSNPYLSNHRRPSEYVVENDFAPSDPGMLLFTMVCVLGREKVATTHPHTHTRPPTPTTHTSHASSWQGHAVVRVVDAAHELFVHAQAHVQRSFVLYVSSVGGAQVQPPLCLHARQAAR